MARQKKTIPGDTRTTGNNGSADPQAVKKRGRPVGSKNKNGRPDRQPDVESGDNSKLLSYSLALSRLPKIDIDNPEQVKNRIELFFDITVEYDMKPAVMSLALAFGFDRYTLYNCLNGRSDKIKNSESLHTIKAAYNVINNYYEQLMNTGRINPVAGIFLMKNNMGYKDTTDYIITAGNDNNMSLPDITNRANLLEE